jgi:hypothetical protein
MTDSPPVLRTIVQQHVFTTSEGHRVCKEWIVETSYALIMGDLDLISWHKMSAGAQKVATKLCERVHAGEVKIAKLDAHVRMWAEQHMTSTGDVHDLPGSLQRAARIAESMEDARMCAIERAEVDFKHHSITDNGVKPHHALTVVWIVARIGLDSKDPLWKVLAQPWIDTYDSSYTDRIAELMLTEAR